MRWLIKLFLMSLGAITNMYSANKRRSPDDKVEPRNPCDILHARLTKIINSRLSSVLIYFSACLMNQWVVVQNANHFGKRKNEWKKVLMPSISSCSIRANPNRKNARCLFLSCGQRAFHAVKTVPLELSREHSFCTAIKRIEKSNMRSESISRNHMIISQQSMRYACLYACNSLPCIEIFSEILELANMFLTWSCLKIFAITDAYCGASDKDLTTE